jgi:hypothetical protein
MQLGWTPRFVDERSDPYPGSAILHLIRGQIRDESGEAYPQFAEIVPGLS